MENMQEYRNKTEIQTYLAIKNTTRTPDEISSLLGIAADCAFRIGDQVGRTIKRWDCNYWELGSGVQFDGDYSSQISALVARFSGKCEVLHLLASEGEVRIVFYAWCRGETAHRILLSTEAIRAVAGIRASLWCDIYMLGRESEPETGPA